MRLAWRRDRKTTAAVCAGILVILLLFAHASCGRSDRFLNLVLVTLDTTRADHLGCYGYFRETSLRIDRLAEQSLLFERCQTPVSMTLPSHLSLLTGLYPLEHGVLDNLERGGTMAEVGSGVEFYAEAFRKEGYRTAAFVSSATLRSRTGIAAGFEVYDEPDQAERRAENTNEAVMEWLSDRKGEKYFLWVHYFDPHSPYAPPPPYDTLFETDEPLLAHLEERRFPKEIVGPLEHVFDVPSNVNLYDGEIRYMDREIGRLLDTLRARPDWERTVFVLVGDHGEGLGQHEFVSHGHTWEEQIRVPLILHGSGIDPGRSPAMLSVVDVIPTVLERCRGLAGGSSLAAASGRAVSADGGEGRDYLFSYRNLRRGEPGKRLAFTLSDGRWKYAVGPDRKGRLYDTRDDPYELENLSKEHPERAEVFAEVLAGEITRQKERGRSFGVKETAKGKVLDPRFIQELKALGYVR